jgi:LPXTG-site transpeptidase (sortase) family protein
MPRLVARVGAAGLVVVGLVSVGIGLAAFVQAFRERAAWQSSVERERIDARLAAPTPVWIEPGRPAPTTAPAAWTRPTDIPATRALPMTRATPTPAWAGPVFAPVARTPVTLAQPRDMHLGAAELRYLSPPDNGAHAHAIAELTNGSGAPTPPIVLGLDRDWLERFQIVAIAPDPLTTIDSADGQRLFELPPIDPGATVKLEIRLIAKNDDVDSPMLRLRTVGGQLIGETRPTLVAPRPVPGQVRRLELPRLGLRTGVVSTTWEPPAFVAGHLADTASLDQGNTVVLGHLNGLAGDVFARLDRAQVGDEVIAWSRGIEVRYVVTDVLILPNDDRAPFQPTDEPRLSLMTCTGHWDPLTQEYSHRLWVIAERPEVAERRVREAADRAAEQDVLASMESLPAPPTVRAAAPTAAPTRAAPLAPPLGLELVSPPNRARVPRELVVQGRTREVASGEAWLFVRPLVAGGSWYVVPTPVRPGSDGQWAIDLSLDGPPDTRHELRLGPVGEPDAARLRQWIRERPGQPLPALPSSLRVEGRALVTRL